MKRTLAFIFALATVAVSYGYANDNNTQPESSDSSVIVLEEAPVLPSDEDFTYSSPKKDKQLVNHLAAGVPIGILFPNGVGIIEVATTLTPHLQFRLGYSLPIVSTLSFTYNDVRGIAASAGLGNLRETAEFNNHTINLGPSKFSFGSNLGGINFFMDVFPGKKAGFHFTFGLYYNPFSPDNLLEIRADMSTALKDAGFTPGKYNEVYFGFNEDDPKFRISPSKDGVIQAGVRTLPVHPYAGIGFGRAIDPSKRVCVSFDMGVLYWGTPILVGYDYSLNSSGTAVGFTPERVAASKDLQSLEQPLKYLSMVSIYPMMKLNIFIRIF